MIMQLTMFTHGVSRMTTNNNLYNLSKEELISMLNKTKSELSHAKEETEVAKKEAATARREAAAYKTRADAAEKRLKAFYKLLKERGELIKETIHGLKDLYILFDNVTFENMERQLGKLFNEFTQWILNAYTWREQAYASGNDLPKFQKEIAPDDKENGKEESNNNDNNDKNGTQQPAEEQAQNAIKALVTSKKAAENLKKQLNTAIKGTNQEDIPSLGKEIHHIAETDEKETENAKKSSPGRQRVTRQPDKTLHPGETSDNVCSECGINMKKASTLKQQAIGLAHDLLDQSENIELFTDFYVCTKCGKVHGVFPENADLPIQPDREICINTALYCIGAISNGYPLYRIAKELQKTKRLGHSTLQENIYACVEIYFAPIRDYFFEREKKNKHLMLDGTPFRCLESQQLGNCMHKNPDRKPNHNQPEPAPVEEGKSNYILCCCSVPDAREPFITYHYLPTRSFEAIAKVITPDHIYEVLISDAFQAYDKLAAEQNCILQNCIVHFRRYVIKAGDLNQLSKTLAKMEEQQQVAHLQKGLQNGNPQILLCCVFLALSKIYSYESSFDRTQPDYLDKILETRQEIERPLMDDIDKVMNYFVENHTDQNNTGEGRSARKGDPYSKPAIYWYNNHDKFRSFLNDPMIPPDTNKVEQNIRTATIIRKNSFFMTSQRGINALCTILTVVKSLSLNGVKNPMAAMSNYCRALYSYCFDKAYTEAYLKDILPGKKLTSWNMIALSEGFDFDKHISEMFNQ